MNARLKPIAVRPKTRVLEHYREMLSEAIEDCQRELDALDATPKAERKELLAKAMRCAKFEGKHMGRFNWSGKELYSAEGEADPSDEKDRENAL